MWSRIGNKFYRDSLQVYPLNKPWDFNASPNLKFVTEFDGFIEGLMTILDLTMINVQQISCISPALWSTNLCKGKCFFWSSIIIAAFEIVWPLYRFSVRILTILETKYSRSNNFFRTVVLILRLRLVNAKISKMQSCLISSWPCQECN